MMRQPPPLRFLVLVVGGWICMRTAVYAPGWWVPEGVARPVPVAMRAPGGVSLVPGPQSPAEPRPPRGSAYRAVAATLETIRRAGRSPSESVPAPAPRLAPLAAALAALPVHATAGAETNRTAPRSLGPIVVAAHPGRWSGSAWLLLRRDGGRALAQGGTLGGGQAGLRIGYRLNRYAARPLSLAVRVYAPARDPRAAEAALGLEWRPFASIPMRLAAERRQALGSRGRSALALGAHGGVSGMALPGGLRLDAYGQAGIVGTRSRDLYADGAARVTMPVGRFDIGAAVSGGAQPGAARLDMGPVLSVRLPDARLRVSAEWRFRIAGGARPGSGPALTIGTDF